MGTSHFFSVTVRQLATDEQQGKAEVETQDMWAKQGGAEGQAALSGQHVLKQQEAPGRRGIPRGTQAQFEPSDNRR